MLLQNWARNVGLSLGFANSSERAKLYCESGIEHYEQKQYQEAINDFTQAIACQIKFGEAYGNRARAYFKLKRHGQAWQDCDRAIELNPKDAMAYTTRAGVKFQLRNYRQAIEDCDRAIELNPRLTKAYYYRGLALCQLKQYPAAVPNFSKVIQANPYLSQAYYNRGLAHAKLGNKRQAFFDWRHAADLFLRKGEMPLYNKAVKLMASSPLAKQEFHEEMGHMIQRGRENLDNSPMLSKVVR